MREVKEICAVNEMKKSQRFRHLPDDAYVLQSAQWPNIHFAAETRPFVRMQRAVGLSLSNGGLNFGVGGRAVVNGYYNLFNIGKWRSFCGEFPLELLLEGKGRFQLTVWVSRQGEADQMIHSEELNLDGGFALALDPSTSNGARSLLWFDLVALSDGTLDDFAWITTEPPRQKPRLTLAITTFKREKEVTETVKRFDDFRRKSDLGEYLRLVVVDNGNSLNLPSNESVKIIKNPNYGGSAGFTRGLLEARAHNATHCLFMDDDASIQMDAIERTWTFLAYTTDPKTAIAGAMINAQRPWELWENGATFDRSCRPRYKGVDLRRTRRVFRMEHETTAAQPPDFYAGWWFFAFPISEVRHLAFPFFVRGDDVSFSIVHPFRFALLPGVASVQDSFTEKASPLTWYLDMRSHLVHHLSLPVLEVSWWSLQKMFLSFYLRTVLRFHYESLSAVNLAIEDILKGPSVFVEDIGLEERRNLLKTLTKDESWSDNDAPIVYHAGKLSRPARAILLLSLNGHLLPLANLFGSRLTICALHRENYREVYGAKEIKYVNAAEDKSYCVRRNRRRFLTQTVRLIRNSLTLLMNYRKMQSLWRSQYADLTSEAFWRDKLSL